MASNLSTKDFFARATSNQFDFTLSHYDTALRLKAESKSSKPENVIKLDKWYQNELPKKIKGRGKDAHLVHDELVQTIKWKLARGKFRPNLTNLIQMNTPRVVMQETKKAFRNLHKKNDLQIAANALCNLKGVGPAMASAVLAAGAPHLAPFMADECLLAMPEVDGLDYTMKEYMRYVEYVKACVERLNSQGETSWTPHKVELTVWTHYILRELNPEILTEMPAACEGEPAKANGHNEQNSNQTVEPAKNSQPEDTAADQQPQSEGKPADGAQPENNSAEKSQSESDATEKPPTDGSPADESQPKDTANEKPQPEDGQPAEDSHAEKDAPAESSKPEGSAAGSSQPEPSPADKTQPEDSPAQHSLPEGSAPAKTNGSSSSPEKSNGSANNGNGTEAMSNGQLENGSSAEEGKTEDLSSSPTAAVKRPVDEVNKSEKSDDGEEKASEENAGEEPAAKKLKACDDAAAEDKTVAAV